MSKAHPPNDLRASFSAKEIAARHNLSPSFVYEEIAAGRLRANKPGGHGPYRITPDAEAEWLRLSPMQQEAAR